MLTEQTERRYSVPRYTPFEKLVDFDTRIHAGFNTYGESSFLIPNQRGESADVYLGHVSNCEETNIVVIRDIKQRPDGVHTDWYLRTFTGSSLKESQEDEEVNDFNKKIAETLARKYRIAGTLLDSRIQGIVEEATTYVYRAPLPR